MPPIVKISNQSGKELFFGLTMKKIAVLEDGTEISLSHPAEDTFIRTGDKIDGKKVSEVRTLFLDYD